MSFEPGHKLALGRPIGSRNKRTIEFLEVLEENGFCAATALMDCYKEAKKTYDNYGLIYDAISEARDDKNHETGQFAAPTEDHAHKYLKIAADIAKELASYSYPKLKAIEQRRVNGTEGMSIEEKLEAARLMVQVLEREVKNEPQSTE